MIKEAWRHMGATPYDDVEQGIQRPEDKVADDKVPPY